MIVMADITVVRNEDEHRYEALIEGKVAGFARFRLQPGQVIFWHTEVDPAYEGKGVGSVLTRHALDDVRTRGEHVVAQCPFIAGYIKRHQEYADLVVEG
jgi:predicted GNAT family acetyltransferase